MLERLIIEPPLEFDRFIIIPSFGSRETLLFEDGRCICLLKVSASGILFAGVAVDLGCGLLAPGFFVFGVGTGAFVGEWLELFSSIGGVAFISGIGVGIATTFDGEFVFRFNAALLLVSAAELQARFKPRNAKMIKNLVVILKS